MLNDPIEAKLVEVSQPTLLLRGANDPFVSRRWLARLIRLTGGRARALELRDAAHAAHYTAPQAVAAAIEAFLSTGSQ
jgi:pimeloyl-ACP methyl ester carboxylesterase